MLVDAVVFDAYGTLLDVHAAMERHAARLPPESTSATPTAAIASATAPRIVGSSRSPSRNVVATASTA